MGFVQLSTTTQRKTNSKQSQALEAGWELLRSCLPHLGCHQPGTLGSNSGFSGVCQSLLGAEELL